MVKVGNWQPAFRDSVWVPSLSFNLRPIGCSETTISSYQFTQRHISEERKPRLIRMSDWSEVAYCLPVLTSSMSWLCRGSCPSNYIFPFRPTYLFTSSLGTALAYPGRLPLHSCSAHCVRQKPLTALYEGTGAGRREINKWKCAALLSYSLRC